MVTGRRFPFDLIDAHFTYPDGLAGVLLAKCFRCPGIVTLRARMIFATRAIGSGVPRSGLH